MTMKNISWISICGMILLTRSVQGTFRYQGERSQYSFFANTSNVFSSFYSLIFLLTRLSIQSGLQCMSMFLFYVFDYRLQ